MNGGEVVFHFKGDDKDLDKKTSELGSKLGDIGKSIGGAFLKGTAVATTAITGLVATSVKMYADVEQSVGGVETLFKDSADTVIANAKRAFRTAGMSANEYMENVTSFSASLLQSLNGDTKKAAEYADRAMVDMSDNANKMGTAMESIQNAYQGFAKQNYTMLDNLKLGYGGTKEEMARLIKDASKMKDVQKELNVSVKDGDMSFGNIVNAISVMQKKLDIAGTTAKEASTTILGSIGSAKSAFENFLSGMGGVDEVVETFTTAGTNIMNAVVKMSPQVIDGLIQMVNALIPQIPPAIQKILPVIVNGATSLLNGLVQAMPQILTMLISILPQITQTLLSMLPNIINIGIQMFIQIIQALADMAPTLIPQIVEAILQIIPILIDNLPLFIKAGWQLLIGIWKGLIQAMPLLLAYIPKIIKSLINYFKQAPSMMLEIVKNGATTIITSLKSVVPGMWNTIKTACINGYNTLKTWLTAKSTELGANLRLFLQQLPSKLADTIGQLLGHIANFGISIKNWLQTELPKILTSIKEWLKQLPSNLWNTLVDMKNKAWNGIQDVAMQIRNGLVQLPGQMLSIGKNVVKGLWNGIKNAKAWLTGKIKSFASGVISGFKKTFGIHSPSKEFAIIGRFNMLGLEKGMDDMQPDLQKSIDGMFDLSPSLYGSASTNLSPQVNVVNNINMKQDPLGQMVNDVKTFSGGAKNDYNYGMA